MKKLIAIAASSLVLVASAIEAPKPAAPPATAPAKEEPATKTPDAAPAEEDEEELPPLPADAASAGPPPARFNPTEKVRADFPVSFPIDI